MGNCRPISVLSTVASSGVVRVRLLGRQSDQWCPPVVLGLILLLGLQEAKPLESPKNLRLTVLKTGSKIDQKHFYVHCSTKVT